MQNKLTDSESLSLMKEYLNVQRDLKNIRDMYDPSIDLAEAKKRWDLIRSICLKSRKIKERFIPPKPEPKKTEISAIEFFNSPEWQQLRYLVLKESGRKCLVCHATGVELHVDHIKPRSKYPELSLVKENLQVLCRDCNLGKGNQDEIDWRKQ